MALPLHSQTNILIYFWIWLQFTNFADKFNGLTNSYTPLVFNFEASCLLGSQFFILAAIALTLRYHSKGSHRLTPIPPVTLKGEEKGQSSKGEGYVLRKSHKGICMQCDKTKLQ